MSILRNKKVKEVIDNYSLRAHLVLAEFWLSPIRPDHLIIVISYLEVAILGAGWNFKSQPVRLKKAISIIQALDFRAESMTLSEAEWMQLRDGVICADEVLVKIPPRDFLEAMVRVQQDIARARLSYQDESMSPQSH